MKKTRFILLIGLVALFLGFSQNELVKAQEKSLFEELFPHIDSTGGIKKVPRMIENSKNIGAIFEKRELFQPNAQKISEDDEFAGALSDGVVFDLDNSAVKNMLKKSPEYLILPIPDGKGGIIELELAKVNIFASGFKVETSKKTNENLEESYGIHYRGIIKGDLNSLASISIFKTEVMGIFSSDENPGSMVLGRLSGNNPDNRHVLYDDRNLKMRPPNFCDVETPDGATMPDPQSHVQAEHNARCIRIFVEANHNIFLNKGSVANTVSFVTGFFNQSATLIANTGATVTLSDVFVWNSPSPYIGTTSLTQLTTFRTTRTSFNGNLAHLVDLQNIGGRAYLDVICNSAFAYGYSGIWSTFSNVPTYSWTVNVFTHELGHNLGSPHTHACAWNGDNTAIDGCFTPEGPCANPGIPSGGGTIMSYCHNQSVGVNFNLGYGPQPSSLILNRFNAAACLTDCDGTGCGSTPIANGQTITGTLSTSDCFDSTTGRNYDAYTFSGTAGQQIAISQSSTDFDTYLYLLNPSGQIIAQDDDGGGGTNSRIPATSGFFTLPATGTYTIRASSFSTGASGAYTLNLSVNSSCPATTISPGQTINGSLTTSDCIFTGTTRYVDVYNFSGNSGQRIAVSMNSAQFDTYLYLVNSASQLLAEDNNGGGGTNARIPAGSGYFTLPATGTYSIWATSSSAGATGTYSINLSNEPVCTYSISPSSQNFFSSGGSGSTTVTAPGGCGWTATSNAGWITITSGSSGSGNGSVGFSVAANTSTSPRTGTMTIAGQTFTVNQSGNSTPIPRRMFDFDGDNKTDISIFRPSVGEWWYLRSSDGSNRAFQFGQPGDIPVPADYTGDGRADIGFFRPSNGFWYILRSEDASFYSFPFGQNGDIPVPADYDGDGKADPAIYRPSNSTWYIIRSSDGGVTIIQFGANGDVPVPADYDGDNKADLAIFRPSDGTWWLNRSQAGVIVFSFGISTDKKVPADYTGDGKADVAIFRPSNSTWYILRSENASFYSVPFGTSGDIPAPGDYDGDGIADMSIFRPSNRTWYIQQSTSGFAAVTFGAATDIPVPSAFVK